jgi:hypothetical protein
MASMGVIILLGGVVEVCWHFPLPLWLGVVSGRKPRFGVESAQWRHLDVVPPLGALHLETLHVVSCCNPSVLVTIQA